MRTKEYIRYSEAFKQQVVSEIESGKFESAYHARQSYGIKETDIFITSLIVQEVLTGIKEKKER